MVSDCGLNLCSCCSRYNYNIIQSFTSDDLLSLIKSILAPECLSVKINVTSKSSSSLGVTWELPAEDKSNGDIVSYTVCISRKETQPCFEEYTTKKKMLVIGNLNASTKYNVRVLVNTNIGRVSYSKSKAKFTNGGKFSPLFNKKQMFYVLRPCTRCKFS